MRKALLVLTAAVCVLASVSASVAGGWVSNGKVAVRVDKVQLVSDWNVLGKFQRVGPKEKAALEPLKKAVESKEYKIALVHLQMRNDSKEKIRLGYWIGSSMDMHPLFLRGSEGTEFCSYDSLSLQDSWQNAKAAASNLTYFLTSGLAQQAEVAPKAVIKGRVAFLVPSWFEPARLFTKASQSTNGFGSKQLVCPVRVK